MVSVVMMLENARSNCSQIKVVVVLPPAAPATSRPLNSRSKGSLARRLVRGEIALTSEHLPHAGLTNLYIKIILHWRG